MDEDAKKTALRMIPYGLYVLTAKTDAGDATLHMRDLGERTFYGG